MNDDLTPHNMQVPSIPILTDIVTRGDKASPEDVFDESMSNGEDPSDLQTTQVVRVKPDSEAITVYPGMESKDDATASKPFSLDEITESLKKENEASKGEASEDPDPVERALETLMPQLETMAREALKVALIDIKSEKSSSQGENSKEGS